MKSSLPGGGKRGRKHFLDEIDHRNVACVHASMLPIAPAGIVYRALNRGNGRNKLFHNLDDYSAFERIVAEAMRRFPIRLLAYCLMPNNP